MNRKDAVELLKDSKRRVAREHPDLVLTKNQQSYYRLVKNGWNYSGDIAGKLNKSVQNVSNSLDLMFNEGYLGRYECVSSSGGKEFQYYVFL